MILRLATPADAAECLKIYAPFIRETAVTFETAVPSAREFATRIEKVLALAPWLVCEEGREIAGYAYGAKIREREAYQWSMEVSVYVAEAFQKRGVGRALYGALLKILRLQGFCNAYAGATLPNAASVAFHESFGFRHVGTYRSIGFKFGAWRDVGWWSLELQPAYPEIPERPRALASLSVEELDRALSANP